MKRVLFFAVCLGFVLNVFAQKTITKELVFDSKWKFTTGDSSAWAKINWNDKAWKTISTTKSWENQGFSGYNGYGWYRKHIMLPAGIAQSAKKYGGIMIKYTNADDVDELYFNGHKIGATGEFPPNFKSAYGTKRKYIVPAEFVNFGKSNVIAVRVYDGIGDGGILSENITVRPMLATDAVKLQYTFPANEWVFLGNDPQQMDLTLKNTLAETVNCKAVLVIKTDKYQPVDSIAVPAVIKPKQTVKLNVPFKLTAPGFYRCSLFLAKGALFGNPEKFNIGFEPEKIISPPDAKPDLENFWKQTREELDKIAPDYKVTLIPERSTGARNMYHVEMLSLGNVKIEGYYAAPKKQGKYPAIITYMGYASDPFFPSAEYNNDFAEFVLSVRGQGIQKPVNTYGDWIVSGLESKENYYYRGAYMDLVRAIDFVTSRPEVDADKIMAEGGSQGGAFTLAAAALDHRLKAIAPTIPFLSDFRDYFQIVSWPRSAFENYLKEHPEFNWEKIYDILAYFDIKNLAGWIQCPVYMAAGLQDEVCPPHTNFAGYNQIRTFKKYHVYHDQGHSVPNEWYQLRMDFFKEKASIK